MTLRRILAAVVGTLQAATGALAVIFAYILYHIFFDVQGLMNISEENVPVHMLLLFVFGFVSIISGLFLIHERLEL
jgi:hypothetical protein